MRNILPKKLTLLGLLADSVAEGLKNHAAALGIIQITEAQLRAATATMRQSMTTYNTGRSEVSTESAEYQAALTDLDDALSQARGVLTAAFAPTWNADWVQTGFPNNSTAVPDTIGEKIALAISLKGFLTTQAAYAVSTPKITFTAARFAALELALNGTSTDLNEEESETGTDKDLREAAALPVRKMLRLIIAILEYYLDENSPLWDAFGLNRPGAISTPGQPPLPIILPALPGQMHGKIPASVVGATHYRWFLRLVGAPAFVFVKSTPTLEVFLTDLTPGSYELQATAANQAGESIPSLPVTGVVG